MEQLAAHPPRRSALRAIRRLAAFVLLPLAVVALAIVIWARSLERENDAARPTDGSYQVSGGASWGGPKPRADGYVEGSLGTKTYLPVMPPDRPMAIHRPDTAAANAGMKACFFVGPRTRLGYYTTDPDGNYDNQHPDSMTTYFMSWFRIPDGGRIVLKGQFPHLRHWSFSTYNIPGEPHDALNDIEIDPDAGSENPFRAGVRRDVANRGYTISIVNGDPPEPRAPNTLYTRQAPDTDVGMLMRNYVPDQSRDVVGSVGFPAIELHRATGATVAGDEACRQVTVPRHGKQVPEGLPRAAYLAMTHMPGNDPMIAPARDFEVAPFEMFFNRQHTTMRLFFSGLPTASLAVQKGGFWSNAATRYGYRFVNRRHGSVYVVRGKMPTTPQTWNGTGDPMPRTQMRYWSLCTAMGLPTGLGVDCLFDEAVVPTLDSKHYFTVVVSRAADRPANATDACGVAWMELGNGDGIVGGSPDLGLLINRHTLPAADFEHSWFSVVQEGTERQTMGEYLPEVVNLHDKQSFEALGCPRDLTKIDARIAAAQAGRK